MRLTIVNGFLGSGKTTFIRRVIDEASAPIPIIVNEFGSATYDADRLEKGGNLIRLIRHGSIFCTCRAEDFVKTLSDLMKEAPPLILIESSGFADPTGMDKLIAQALRRAGLREVDVCALSIADPLTFMKLIGSMAMLRRQIEVADTILINKADLSDPLTLDRLAKNLRLINPKAIIATGSYGQLDPKQLKTHQVTESFDGSPVSKKDPFNKDLTLQTGSWKDEETVIACLEALIPLVYRLKGTIWITEKAYDLEIASGLIKMIPTDHADNRITLLYSLRNVEPEVLIETVKTYNVTLERVRS